MSNPMPALDEQQPLDFHTSLGVVAQLLSLQPQHPFSIELYYKLVRTAMENQRCFIALNPERQPIGAVIWIQCDDELVQELQCEGWGSENDLLTLMNKHKSQGKQYLLIHINSPFGQQLEVINAWQQYVQNVAQPCWALADKGNASLRKLC
ncbi:MAG: hypothetical protein HRU06_13390 [Oceanospirillaceae bacterium]|nr:hypothetical protein [Oceanospirillaceae bacterium]